MDSQALAELLRLDSLPESYMSPPDIAELRVRVRRWAFLVRQRTKLKVKIRGVLAYEGIKPPKERRLFTRKGADWLRSLGLDPLNCYLRLMELLKEEIRLLSRELQGLAWDDPDARLLVTVLGVDYYIALLVKAEIGDLSRFSSVDYLASYAGLVSSTRSSGGVDWHGRITKEGSS